VVKGTSFLPSIVFIFFSLSGFVIAMSMHRNQFRLKDVGAFIARRWVRIEVPYIVSILVYLSIAFAWSLKDGTGFSFEPLRLAHHLFYTIPFTEYSWYNEVYWTLALEFQFYILIALLFPFFASKNMWLRFSALACFSLTAFIVPDNRLLFLYAPMFSVGILLYFHVFSGLKSHSIAWILMGLMVLQIGVQFDISAAFFIALSIGVTQVNLSEKNPVTRIGKMGYSLYLLHGAAGGSLLYFLAQYNNTTAYNYFIVLLGVLFSIALSYVFYRLIERPSIRGARRIHFGKHMKSNES
jgi:peptidoglycan/LPS O-acetylase OafA/YrhL